MADNNVVPPDPLFEEKKAKRYYRFTLDQDNAAILFPTNKESKEKIAWFDKEYYNEYTCLRYDDINDPKGLIKDFKQCKTKVAKEIFEDFPLKNQQKIDNLKRNDTPSINLLIDIIHSINGFLLEPFYSKSLFHDIELSDEIIESIEKNPEGEELVKLNRKLIENVFPKRFKLAGKSYDWDKAYTYNIYEVKNEDFVYKPIRLYATMHTLSEGKPMIFNPEKEEPDLYTYYKIFLKDLYGFEITCLLITYQKFGNQLHRLIQRPGYYVFEGAVFPSFEPDNPVFLFYLKNINFTVRPLDMIRISPDPEEKIQKKFYKESEKPGGIREYIKTSLIKNLPIKGLKKAKELNKAIDFMIIQSFSRGLSEKGDYSNKLHSLVIGPSGTGKKLLTRIALILNPVSFEISSTVEKITPAGLIGSVQMKEGRTISNPGYLPRASGGVICIQDFHEISSKSTRLMSILSKVMEDGEAIDSTSAMTSHKAIASVHLDTNRLSQIRPLKSYDKYSDLNVQINLLSRFDFIIEIPEDHERQYEVAEDMIKGSRVLYTREFNVNVPEWIRELRVMTAFVSTNFHTTEIKDKEAEYISTKLNDIISGNSKYKETQKLLKDYIIRMSISIQKYAKAIACSDLSPIVRKYHVDEAFEFIFHKLKFLSEFTSDDTKKLYTPAGFDQESRIEAIYAEYKGKVVKLKDMHAFIENKFQIEISERAVRRDLDLMVMREEASKPKQKHWKILK